MNQIISKPAINRMTSIKRLALHAAALASVVLSALSHQAVQAQSAVLPQGATVVNGQANINTSGNQMNVINTPGAVINWNSFNIGTGAGVNFQQQNANSSVMNRVVGGNISTIHGNLTSNGRVILVNPAGLVIGAGAVVDTAGFVGSAMNATEANGQLDRLRFDAAGGAGRIQVDGIIRSASGDIVLIAPDIEVGKQGLIQAPGGAVMLAAGQRVQLKGKGLDGIMLELQAPSDSAINLGRLEGQAVGLFAGQLRHSGAIDARHASIEGGRIVLKAADNLTVTGVITADGSTDAQGNSGKGGNITLEGSTIALQGANISASGPAGGGNINVGGGWQGKDTAIRNASQTFVDQTTQINANATQNGNGGQVVIWSDGDTWYAGKIESKGGATAGNGGKVEVSGKQRLGFYGQVNTGAANGRSGMLLLDPQDILISNSVATSTQTVTFLDPGTIFNLNAGNLSLVTGDILLQANRDITVLDGIVLNSAGGTNLTLEAGRNVNIDNSIVGVGALPNTVTVIANSSSTNVVLAERGIGPGGINMSGLGLIDVGSTGAVNLLVQNSPNNPNAGGITLTRVIAGNVVMSANTNIQMDASALTLHGIDANRIVLLSETGNIGTLANPVIVRPVGLLSDEVALSVYATTNIVDTTAGNAYVQGRSASGPSGGSFTVKVAPGLNPQDLTSAPTGAVVGGEFNLSNAGPIRIGAAGAESGSADINAANIVLTSGNGLINGQITVAQNNGNDLSIVADQNISMTVVNGTLDASILIGGPGSGGETGIVAGNSLTLESTGASNAGILVQGGAGLTNFTSLQSLNTTSLKASGNIDVVSAQVGGNTGSGITTLNSTLGDIAILAPLAQDALVTGGSVEIVALGGDVLIQAGAGSSAVRAGLAGAQISTGDLQVYSINAAANQTSSVTANGNGVGINLNATSISITGGSAAGARAEVATLGGGSVNIITNELSVNAGPGSGSAAVINSSGYIDAQVTNSIIIDGSKAVDSNNGLVASTNVNLNVNELRIQAPTGVVVNSTYGISASGLVAVTADFAINVLGPVEATSNNSAALINGVDGVNLRMTNTDQSIFIQGGAGEQTGARIQSSGVINIDSAGFLAVIGGSGTGSVATISGLSAVNVIANNLNILAGTGNSVGALIESVGNVNATVGNTIVIAAGGANLSSTGIKSQGDVNLTADTLQISAFGSFPTNNSDYGITATGVVGVTTTGGITLYGDSEVSSQNTVGQIYGGTGVSISSANSDILISGGAGLSTNALIASGGNILLASGGGDLIMNGGNGINSNAIVTTSGTVTLNVVGVGLTAGTNSSHALIYAGSNSVTLALANPTQTIATLGQAGSTSPAIGAIIVPAPDVSTTIALPSGLPVGTTGTAVVTFTNLSPLPTNFTATVNINGITQTVTVFLNGNQTAAVPVVITSTFSGGTVSVNVNSLSAVLNTTPLPENNLTNNAAAGSFAPLFADISTTLVLPAGGIPGSFVNGTFTFTNNGAATTTFIPTIVVDGFTTTGAPMTLAPGQSMFVQLPVQVGTAGATVNVIAAGSTIPETGLGNNGVSGNLAPFIADISTIITAPATAAAGSLVPVNYTFTNNGAFTTTFTPVIMINGITTTLAPITLAPGQSITSAQNVMIAGTTISITANPSNTSLPDLNLSNNVGTAATIALLPNIQASISSPASATIGGTTTALITYVNTGTVSAQFTSTVSINGVDQITLITLGAGQSQSFSVIVPVGTSGAIVSANAVNIYDSSLGDNSASFKIAGVAAPVVMPPVLNPPIVNPVASPQNIQSIIADNQLQQDVIVGQLVPGGSSIDTNNSGDTTSQRPDSREDIQTEGLPICR
jgi:filamentous hemagglutinin family protein